jgi:hypothetical protein
VLFGLAPNTVNVDFRVGRRFRCTMRVDCGQLVPGTVIRPVPGEWELEMPKRLNKEELAASAPGATRSISSRR